MTGRGAVWTAAKALIAIAVLAFLVFVLRRIGFRSILEAIGRFEPKTVIVAGLLYLGAYFLWAFRWQQLMKPDLRGHLGLVFPIYLAGVFGNVVTPGARVGGEPIRAYYMNKAVGGEKTAHLGTILVDKFGHTLVFWTILVASIIFIFIYVPVSTGVKVAMVAAIFFVLTAIVSGFLVQMHLGVRSRTLSRLLSALYHSAPFEVVRRRFHSYQHFEEYAIRKIGNVFTPIAQAAGSPKALAKILGISLAAWLFVYTANLILFRGLGVELGFLQVVVITTLAEFIGDMSLSPGGAGMMEAAMIGICAAFGVESSTAAAVTLVSRGFFYFIGLGLGGTSLIVLTYVYGRRSPGARANAATEGNRAETSGK